MLRQLHVSGVRDLRVVRNSSGRAEAVRALTASGWKQFPGQVIRTRFKLGSTDFDIHAMTLDDLPGRLVYGNHVGVQGWVRGLGKARLQELTAAGWQTVRHLQPTPSGHFAVSIPAVRSTELRLAYNGVAGDAVSMQVVPRVSLSSRNGRSSRARLSVASDAGPAAHEQPLASRRKLARSLQPQPAPR